MLLNWLALEGAAGNQPAAEEILNNVEKWLTSVGN